MALVEDDMEDSNPDLEWSLDDIQRRQLATAFIMMFENRICVYSETVCQIYTNYTINFPREENRKMVVLPDPYAFHDTLQNVNPEAITHTGLFVIPGELIGKQGLYLNVLLKGKKQAPVPVPFKKAIAHIIGRQKAVHDPFLPILIKGDLREFDDQIPCLHMHRIQLSKLDRLSEFDKTDLKNSLTEKLKELYWHSEDMCLDTTEQDSHS